jgi:NAD(P)-dependent dehydrogenase (short-subunit alcohol dehydrogenase family)
MRLKDKVAIITGAASGIGREIAMVFAREGAKVAIADLDQQAADIVARRIDPASKRAIGVAMDVANEQEVEDGTARVVKTLGSLDILISNAGIQIVTPIVDFEFAKWKRLLSIHLDGAFLTTRAALRQMYRQKSGVQSTAGPLRHAAPEITRPKCLCRLRHAQKRARIGARAPPSINHCDNNSLDGWGARIRTWKCCSANAL